MTLNHQVAKSICAQGAAMTRKGIGTMEAIFFSITRPHNQRHGYESISSRRTIRSNYRLLLKFYFFFGIFLCTKTQQFCISAVRRELKSENRSRDTLFGTFPPLFFFSLFLCLLSCTMLSSFLFSGDTRDDIGEGIIQYANRFDFWRAVWYNV